MTFRKQRKYGCQGQATSNIEGQWTNTLKALREIIFMNFVQKPNYQLNVVTHKPQTED